MLPQEKAEKTAGKIIEFLEKTREHSGKPSAHTFPLQEELTLCYAKRGELLPNLPGKTDPESDFQALEDCIFQLAQETQGEKVVGHRWLGTEKSIFELHLTQLLKDAGEKCMDENHVQACAGLALLQHRKRRERPAPNTAGPEPEI